MTKGKWPNGLRAAMKAKDIGPAALGRLINENRQSVLRWRDQERELSPSMATRIAPHLDTTAAALLLLPDEAEPVRQSERLAEFLALAAQLGKADWDAAKKALNERRASEDQQEAQPARRARTKAKS